VTSSNASGVLRSGNICAMPAANVRDHRENRPWALISISSPGDESWRPKNECPNLIGRLDLTFDNVERISHGTTAFWMGDAEKVLEFFAAHRDGAQAWVVHCAMGESRSPAIAAALDLLITGKDAAWHAKRTPNRRVYECLISAANRQGLISGEAGKASIIASRHRRQETSR
jgi:predicted protein tyrosine phosphatase